MAADIERDLGLTSSFVADGGGIFEVRLDSRVVYTNGRQGGVPPSEPVIEAVRRAALK